MKHCKKKAVIMIIAFASILLILWSAMLITDTVKSQNFEEPVFARLSDIQPDDLSQTYKGPGYTVYYAGYADEAGNVYPEASEVRLFGILIAAVIT